MSVVRTAIASDLDACVEIGGGVLDKAQFAQAISGSGPLFLIAEWGGAPVGFLVATPEGGVQAFAVEVPGLWPSVGQHLLREVRSRLKARGVPRITVGGGDAARDALLATEGLAHNGADWTAAV